MDGYKTSRFADIGNPFRPLSDAEKKILQNRVEKVYSTFTGHVADGRKMKQSDVDSIGQGRVWSGTDALRIGLVDTLGNLDDAIKIAARLSKISKYRVTQLPYQKEPLQELLNNLSGDAESYFMKNKLGEQARWLEELNKVLKMQGIQMRMPYDVIVK